MSEPTFAEYVAERLDDIFTDTTGTLEVYDEAGGVVEFPFPSSLFVGDDDRTHLIGEAMEYSDEAKRMVKEAIIFSMVTLPESGIQPHEPLFALIASISATYYVRGYLIGALDDLSVPSHEEVDTYIADVITQINEIVKEHGLHMDPVVLDLESEE